MSLCFAHLICAGALLAPEVDEPLQGPPVPASQPGPLLTLHAMEATAPRMPDEVTLADLRRSPSGFTDRSVRCPIQLAAVDAPFDPWLSRFDPARELCIQAWGDDQPIWHQEEFADPAERLFVRRDSAVGKKLAAARPHDRFLATLRVTEVWFGEPWIEVESVVSLSPTLGEGTILHASRAHTLWNAGQRELATSELERALASPLPINVHLALEAELDSMRQSLRNEPPRVIRPLPPGESTVYRLDLR